MNRKPRVAVLFGGRSPEHWISVKSGLFALLFLDRTRYEVDAVYIQQDGRFASGAEYLAMVDRFFAENRVVLFGDSDGIGDPQALFRSAASDLASRWLSLGARGHWDLLFPVFHGRHGEDGTVQGLADVLGIPYAGCSFQASVLGMDKILTKTMAAARGLAVAPFREVHHRDWASCRPGLESSLVADLGLPLFVKPARLGSSIGVGRATDARTLGHRIDEALEYDHRILVETEVRGPECAVGVLGGPDRFEVSVAAEYTSQPENFDYDSKYGPDSLPDIIPASLGRDETARLLAFSRDVARALKLTGWARIDTFWSPQGPVLNEINTMPGLNPGSPFIRAWEVAGVSKRELLVRAVDLGLGKP
jgi:D-alanine-D-alanine ligase